MSTYDRYVRPRRATGNPAASMVSAGVDPEDAYHNQIVVTDLDEFAGTETHLTVTAIGARAVLVRRTGARGRAGDEFAYSGSSWGPA